MNIILAVNPIPEKFSVNESTHNKIWDSASIEEQQRLKEFWESLDESKKLDLVKIDKDSIMRMFKNETRHHLQQQLLLLVLLQPQQQQSQQNVSTSSNNGSSSGINNNLITTTLIRVLASIVDEEIVLLKKNWKVFTTTILMI